MNTFSMANISGVSRIIMRGLERRDLQRRERKGEIIMNTFSMANISGAWRIFMSLLEDFRCPIIFIFVVCFHYLFCRLKHSTHFFCNWL